MLALQYVEQKGKSAGDQNGVGYCPFPVLGHDIAVVSRQ